jgi:hypothetical protein
MRFLSTGQLLATTIIFLAGCQSAGSAAVPARIGADRMTSACTAQMQKFITSKQGLATVLTPAAFAQSDSLSIVEAPLTDKTGQLAQGRVRDMPETYRLSKGPAGCTILRESDGTSAVLDACNCAPLG